jgi:chlorophyllide a reductase subunit X
LFDELSRNVAEAPPQRPKPLSQDELLGLFKGEAVGRGYQLQPATFEDMCGTSQIHKPSLEVIYDAV